MTDLGRQVWALATPAIAWTVHFIAVYALISASCAPRALLDQTMLGLSVLAVTAVGLLFALWPLVLPPAGESLTRSIRWGGFIFALAIVFQALPLVFYSSCGG
jgi:hypothetical protein